MGQSLAFESAEGAPPDRAFDLPLPLVNSPSSLFDKGHYHTLNGRSNGLSNPNWDLLFLRKLIAKKRAAVGVNKKACQVVTNLSP
jgi:hypothetical protein